MKSARIAGMVVAASLLTSFAVALRQANSPPLKGGPTLANGEMAILASGCFWGLEEALRQLPGVIETTVGYTGGAVPNPTYEMVSARTTGHREAVRVVFDPARLSYEALLGAFFSRHDPTIPAPTSTESRTGYHSVIFHTSDTQRQTAERVKTQLGLSGRWGRPITTTIVPASEFYPAEEYHQKYLLKSSGGNDCPVPTR